MSANTEREIRLTEIPTELRNLREEAERWRARWAQDTTIQRQQIRDLTDTLANTVKARDAARKTVDDLTEHCEGQGRRIASLERSVSTLDEVVAGWRAQSAENFKRADKLAEWVEIVADEYGYTHDDLSDLIRDAGVECDGCSGTGTFYAGPRFHDCDTSEDLYEPCEFCHGIGKELR